MRCPRGFQRRECRLLIREYIHRPILNYLTSNSINLGLKASSTSNNTTDLFLARSLSAYLLSSPWPDTFQPPLYMVQMPFRHPCRLLVHRHLPHVNPDLHSCSGQIPSSFLHLESECPSYRWKMINFIHQPILVECHFGQSLVKNQPSLHKARLQLLAFPNKWSILFHDASLQYCNKIRLGRQANTRLF